MASNYPPGVSENDIDGNTNSEEWDELFDWLLDSGLEPDEIKDLIRPHATAL